MYHPEAINAPGKPSAKGQIVKYISEFGGTCVDIAELDRYGRLVWVSMPESHPLYSSALNGSLGTYGA